MKTKLFTTAVFLIISSTCFAEKNIDVKLDLFEGQFKLISKSHKKALCETDIDISKECNGVKVTSLNTGNVLEFCEINSKTRKIVKEMAGPIAIMAYEKTRVTLDKNKNIITSVNETYSPMGLFGTYITELELNSDSNVSITYKDISASSGESLSSCTYSRI